MTSHSNDMSKNTKMLPSLLHFLTQTKKRIAYSPHMLMVMEWNEMKES